MTFKDITINIFLANTRKYLSFFLCNSFTIMTFFIFATLFFNDNISDALQKTVVLKLMGAAMSVIFVFSSLFISYAHSSFVKSRNKEFGLFLTLGMTPKDVAKILGLENSIIAGVSLGTGMLLGTVFSRLFFMIVIELLDINNIKFSLNYKSYALTVGAFLLIFITLVSISWLMTKKLQITELLKESRRVKGNKITHPFLGIMGIALIIASFVMLDLHLKDKLLAQQNYFILLFIFLGLLGLYITESQIGSSLINLSKLVKSCYFRNLLTITEINHKFNQNKKIFFIITILSAVAMFFIGISFSLYSQTLKTVIQEQPQHVVFMEKWGANKISWEELTEIVSKAETPVREIKTLEFLSLPFSKTHNGQPDTFYGYIDVISDKQFNQISGEKASVKKGQAIILEQIAKPEQNQWFTDKEVKLYPPESTYSSRVLKGPLQVEGKKYIYQFQQEIYEIVVNLAFHNFRVMLILNDDDYLQLKKEIHPKNSGKYQIINFAEWEKTKNIADELAQVLSLKNGNKFSSSNQYGILDVKSRVYEYDGLKKTNSFLLFISSFIGLLFFISSGSVLYFKVTSEMDEVREKYRKLFKLGITSKEIQQQVSKELVLMFFIPVILGCIMGYSYIGLLTANVPIRQEILRDSFLVILVYLLFQSAYFLVTKRKQVEEIEKFIKSEM